MNESTRYAHQNNRNSHTAASLPVALIAPVTLLPVHPASNYCPYLRVTACRTAAPASSELRWEGCRSFAPQLELTVSMTTVSSRLGLCVRVDECRKMGSAVQAEGGQSPSTAGGAGSSSERC